MMTRTEIDARTVVPRWIRGCTLLLTIMVGVALVAGCGTIPKRTPLPEVLSHKAEIAGIPRARAWGDETFSWTDEWFALSREELQTRYPALYRKEHNYLAISGGGSNGAFTAGLLLGWTETGHTARFHCGDGYQYRGTHRTLRVSRIGL